MNRDPVLDLFTCSSTVLCMSGGSVLPGGLTFSQVGHGERDADDPHQVFNGDQRPQNRPDADRFTFASVY